jgi:hypothetical protein
MLCCGQMLYHVTVGEFNLLARYAAFLTLHKFTSCSHRGVPDCRAIRRAVSSSEEFVNEMLKSVSLDDLRFSWYDKRADSDA